MKTLAENDVQRLAERRDLNHDCGDLVCELRKRLETLWRYGEGVAASEGEAEWQQTWRELERQEQTDIERLKQMIISRIEKGEFPIWKQ